MKKLLPVLIADILVLGGFGAVAIQDKEYIENKPLITQDWLLEIEFKGGLFRYTVTIDNIGNESVNGQISIEITTDAWIMLLGSEHFGFSIDSVEYTPEESQIYKFGPVRGFGPAKINLSGVFTHEIGEEYPFEAEVEGFVFLFYIFCGKTTLNIP